MKLKVVDLINGGEKVIDVPDQLGITAGEERDGIYLVWMITAEPGDENWEMVLESWLFRRGLATPEMIARWRGRMGQEGEAGGPAQNP